jgi:hypothetical protein
MAMPKESYLIPTAVPTRASSTATQPLAQPVTVGNMPSPAQSQAATAITPAATGGAGRQAPSNVSSPSGTGGGYPSGVNGFPRRGQ